MESQERFEGSECGTEKKKKLFEETMAKSFPSLIKQYSHGSKKSNEPQTQET